MGYDMYIRGEMTAAERAELDAANALFRSRADARDALGREGTTIWRGMSETGIPEHWTTRVAMEDGEHLVGTAEWVAAQQAVNAAYRALNRADVGYFRLNIWGMGIARSVMYPLGMCHDECAESAPDLTLDPTDEDYGRADYTEWRLANEPALPWAPEVPGIFARKLGSNDGWWVSPIECLGALDAWEKADTVEQCEALGAACDEPIRWWPEWLDYLRRASLRNGFLVH